MYCFINLKAGEATEAIEVFQSVSSANLMFLYFCMLVLFAEQLSELIMFCIVYKHVIQNYSCWSKINYRTSILFAAVMQFTE